MIRFLKDTAKRFLVSQPPNTEDVVEIFIRNGSIPWSTGYDEYRWNFIANTLNSRELLSAFSVNKPLPDMFALGLDERTVEYPWIFSRISNDPGKMLDAGSTFNFPQIVSYEKLKNKELSILTFYPEAINYNSKRISYVYSDLRDIPFKNDFFDEIICQSTLEHIDMDNSIYGYKGNSTKSERSYDYLKALVELIRVLKPGGRMLLTFPFGKYEHHGFFQQFDSEMLRRLLDILMHNGKARVDYFKYEISGWRFAEESELASVMSFNPHTGVGKGEDGAAHCRSVACIDYIKNKQ